MSKILASGYNLIDYNQKEIDDYIKLTKELFVSSNKDYKTPKEGFYLFDEREIYTYSSNLLYDKEEYLRKIYETLFLLSCDVLSKLEIELAFSKGTLLELLELDITNIKSHDSSVLRFHHYFKNDNLDSCHLDEHQDLDLLTVVLSDIPTGLEIYNFEDIGYWDTLESHSNPRAVIMAGEMLSKITNNNVLPATHRVSLSGKERYSIVFHLKPRNDLVLNSNLFETKTTQKFYNPFVITAGDFYKSEIENRTSVNNLY